VAAELRLCDRLFSVPNPGKEARVPVPAHAVAESTTDENNFDQVHALDPRQGHSYLNDLNPNAGEMIHELLNPNSGCLGVKSVSSSSAAAILSRTSKTMENQRSTAPQR
jgi:hypothetical protein